LGDLIGVMLNPYLQDSPGTYLSDNIFLSCELKLPHIPFLFIACLWHCRDCVFNTNLTCGLEIWSYTCLLQFLHH